MFESNKKGTNEKGRKVCARAGVCVCVSVYAIVKRAVDDDDDDEMTGNATPTTEHTHTVKATH